MSRPVCGACGGLDVASDPCGCDAPSAPLDRAVEEARKAKRYDFRDVSLSYQTDWQPVEEEYVHDGR